MVFIATINNISDISWQSVVLVEKTGLHTSSIVIIGIQILEMPICQKNSPCLRPMTNSDVT
jgi:hypothetical protein